MYNLERVYKAIDNKLYNYNSIDSIKHKNFRQVEFEGNLPLKFKGGLVQ